MNATQEAAVLKLLNEGASQRQVGAALGLNPVTVGRVAKRAGITYPKAQAHAAARRGKTLRQPERAFQAQVEELATLLGWTYYHPWTSVHSVAGWPDLVLVRAKPDGGARMVIAELKAEDGQLTPAQEMWIELLRKVPGIEVFVWKPSDWPEIERILAA